MKFEKVKKKIYTPLEALSKAMKYCAMQERSQQEVRIKLFSWDLNEEQTEFVISELISQGFVNEERFARAFARGKFRIKKWGRIKIKIELKKHKITPYCINKGLAEIDEKEYRKILAEVLKKKEKELKGYNEKQRKYRLITFAAGRGFEQELIWEILDA